MIAYSAPVPGFLGGTLEPHPDGDGVIVIKPNGHILSVNPQGGVEERPKDAAGAWEKFVEADGKLVAQRDGRVYVMALVKLG